MKNIIFIRHSESIANAGGVTMAHDAIPLSELGKAQAQALATVLDLQPGRIVVSEYVRTYQTALPFCNKVSMQPMILSALNEFSCLDPALIQGMVGAQRRPIAEAYWGKPPIRNNAWVNKLTPSMNLNKGSRHLFRNWIAYRIKPCCSGMVSGLHCSPGSYWGLTPDTIKA